jgi:hypothetical protein
MANLKFSQFTEQTDPANVAFVVGYNGSTNVKIDPANIGGGLFEGLSGTTVITQRKGSGSATGYQSTLSGGSGCYSQAAYSTVGGGYKNTASSYASTVSGGLTNVAINNGGTTVSGGSYNSASGYASSVGGGRYNSATGRFAAIACGSYNVSSGVDSAILGGMYNTASGYRSTIGGGSNNTATGDFSFVGGGMYNNNAGTDSTIIGGRNNVIESSASFATVSGYGNRVIAANSSSHILGDNITSDRTNTTFVENLSIKAIPTSATGLPAGSVWSNGNVLNIV